MLLAGATRPFPGLATAPPASQSFRRVRPSDPAWPAAEHWAALDRRVGGNLVRPQSPFGACGEDACREAFAQARNPFFLGDHPALTQTSGWLDAWSSAPSAYAVTARHAGDVAAAVDFARENHLRLVVKGGGHSYHGNSNAADSLLVWTRRMRDVTLHEAFVAQGCGTQAVPAAAVSLGAGALWLHAYDAVTTRGGRYVQGGGCTTVGVAGLLLGGGFGSFSKCYGLAAASLIEAEIVTADGAVRIANARTNPDLFWALKGGGGGFGIVTRATLRTHELPETFGAVFGTIRATSDAAYHRLIERFIALYADHFFNPHWGEIARFRPDNSLGIGMVFQGLPAAEAERIWQPFLTWVEGAPRDFAIITPPQVLALPARRMWDAAWLRQNAPGLTVADDRPGAPSGNFLWAGDAGQAGQFLHGYASAWLPAALLSPAARATLAEGLFEATRQAPVALHFNKGLAGAPADARAAARDTAINPAVLDAFALAISAAEGRQRFGGQPESPAELQSARHQAARNGAAIERLRRVAPAGGSYVWESDFFQREWQDAFWGSNHKRLLEVKRRYDPKGLFFLHHGVGSEEWSQDGFTQLRN
jgi:FAD/FMN-containing dehydrogenase